jgi:hypothetical protein
MTIKEVYEKYSHLDQLLSDEDWLDIKGNIKNTMLFEFWQVIKEEALNRDPTRMENHAANQARG